MQVKDRALMKIMLDALIDAHACLDTAHKNLTEDWGMKEIPKFTKCIDRANRVINRALIQLGECDLG